MRPNSAYRHTLIICLAEITGLSSIAAFPAPPYLRGTTLAVHSTFGFGAAFFGPLTVGVLLDIFGGGLLAWGMGFLAMAAACLLGPVFLYFLGSDAGDK